ncbi:MAG: NAD-dependent epimerase [Pseudomonadota bacterium]
MKTILVTGAAGFIGYHVSRALLARGDAVVGLDNLNDYYEVSLKQARLVELAPDANFSFVEANLEDQQAMDGLFSNRNFHGAIHLAAQAGVRYSLENPRAYVNSNIVGFTNVLECCRHHSVEHLVYASSSSVYGLNGSMPFSVHDNVDHPVSLYAASKKANELMAHSYAHLYGIPTTGLRFFTVYGPWGRPDMAPILFASAIKEGRPIKVFNNGQMQRDFTYIDDIVEGVVRVLDTPATPNPAWNSAEPDPGSSPAPYRLYNIGNNQPVKLMDFIAALEKAMGKTAEKEMPPMQPGDVTATFADIDALEAAVNYRPRNDLDTGVARFVDWFCNYYAT